MTTLAELSRDLAEELRRIDPEQPGELAIMERYADVPGVAERLAAYRCRPTLAALRRVRVAVVREQSAGRVRR